MQILRSKEKFYKEWLEEKSPWFRNKLWQVLVELKAAHELIGGNRIKLPLERFKKKNIDLDEARQILINLDNNKIIFTFKELGRTPPSDDPQKPTGSIGIGVKDNESVFYDPKTEVTLTHEFKYLYLVLEKIQHPERKKAVSTLDKKADKIINQFSLGNLSFVLGVLQDIANAIELAPENKPVNYQLPPSMTPELSMARQLIDKFDSLGLFRNGGENDISGIVSVTSPNKSLILKCMERGKRRLAMDELEKRRKRAGVQKIVKDGNTEESSIKHSLTQGSLVGYAERFLKNREEEDNALRLKKVDELEQRLVLLEQQNNTKKITPKQIVKEILKQKIFPKKQKALINALSDTLPKNTKVLKDEIGTGDLSSLKGSTLATIKKYGLSDTLSIESYKDGFEYFYRLTVSLVARKTDNKS